METLAAHARTTDIYVAASRDGGRTFSATKNSPFSLPPVDLWSDRSV